MEDAKKQKKAINAEIDRLEATFEENRREMLRLAECYDTPDNDL